MGIPSYFSYITRNLKYKNEITNICFHCLFLDCNSIIYDVYNSHNKNDCIDNIENFIILGVIQNIEKHIEFICPTKLVYIAFDGVAPFAKMEQQRKRRYKSAFMEQFAKLNEDGENTQPYCTKWNTSHITPGTTFMNNLSLQVSQYFKNKTNKFKTIVSGSNEYGEGEHKLFEYIRKHDCSNDYIALYGLDADLIMLSLFHLNITKNIFIFREEPAFLSSSLKQVNKEEKKNIEMLFIDVELLSCSVLNELNCKYNNKQRIYDYIFLCFFLGNDFLPHFPSLNLRTNGMQILLDNYRKYIGNFHNKYLVHFFPDKPENSFINWKIVKLFINELSKHEHEYLLHEYKLKEKTEKYKWTLTTKEERENILNNIPIIDRSVENYICPTEKMWEYRYYKILFQSNDKYSSINSIEREPLYNNNNNNINSQCSHEQIKNISTNYIEGLDWVFQYYIKECPDWKWKYKYNYPPLLHDLSIYTPIYKQGFSFFNNIKMKLNNKPFSPKTQLGYVIPPLYFNKIIGEYNTLLLKERYSEYYREETDITLFQWAFCRFFWESHIILPDIPLPIMEEWETYLQSL